MNHAVVMICAESVRQEIKDEPDLIKRIEKAFAAAKGFFMSTDENIRFNGALAAVLLETIDEAEKARVIASKKSLDKLNAVFVAARAGMAVDLTAADMPAKDNIPLLRLWQDAAA